VRGGLLLEALLRGAGAGLGFGEAGGELLSLPFGAGTQPVELGGGAGAHLLELAGGVVPGPGGFRAGRLAAGLGCGGPLPGLLSVGAGLVPGGLGGTDGAPVLPVPLVPSAR